MEYGLTFFTPADRELVRLFAPQDHMIHKVGHIALKRHKPLGPPSGASVLATVTLPYVPDSGGTVLKPSFASIHSNPPGEPTKTPAIAYNRFGKGQACYVFIAQSRPRTYRSTADSWRGLVSRLLGAEPNIHSRPRRSSR